MSDGRRGRSLPGSIVVLALLLAAPAAGQTPLVDVPASAAGPVHFSRAGVTRQTGAQNNVTLLHFRSTTNPSAGDVLPVMGRGFGLVAVAVTIPNYPQPNTWFVRGAPSISASNRDDLAVVIVGPAGTTPRVFRLSDTVQTSVTGAPPSVNYIGPVVSWAAQLHTDLNTYPTASDWTVLVVDHTNPDVDLDALTYTPPPPPPPPPAPPAPSRVTGVRVSPRDGALHVSWSAAAGEVSQYRVDAADAAGMLARRVYTDADVLDALVEGLANGVDYTVHRHGADESSRRGRAGVGAADGDAGLRRRRYGRDSRSGPRPAARRRRRPGRAAGRRRPPTVAGSPPARLVRGSVSVNVFGPRRARRHRRGRNSIRRPGSRRTPARG